MKPLTVMAISATLLTLVLCSLPGDAVEPLYDAVRLMLRSMAEGGGHGKSLLSADKVAHFVMFAGVAALWMLKFKSPKANLWVLVAAIAFGAGIEVEQKLWIAGRHGDVWDLLADSLGAITGINCVMAARYWKGIQRQSNSSS